LNETIVVALGGNALAPSDASPTIESQFSHTRESMATIVELAREGWRIAVVHGNGPQVGAELWRNEIARDKITTLPLGVLVASTAGWIGYMIQQSLRNALDNADLSHQVVTMVTQTEVSPDDPRLERATKPIGNVLDEAGKASVEARGFVVGRDGKNNWKRMAPSPTPVSVLESEAVAQLVNEGKIVVACGGGGPPVYRDPSTGGWEGIDAVIDKDLTASVLATDIAATTLLILTDVDGVYHDWGGPEQRRIDKLTRAEAIELLKDGSVSEGSMRPKVAAAVGFLKSGGGRAIIAELGQGLAALRGETGTTIRRD
jgi:carbamate kinase